MRTDPVARLTREDAIDALNRLRPYAKRNGNAAKVAARAIADADPGSVFGRMTLLDAAATLLDSLDGLTLLMDAAVVVAEHDRPRKRA